MNLLEESVDETSVTVVKIFLPDLLYYGVMDR